MRRRDFLGLLGSAAAWPVVAGAQQLRIPKIGILWHAGSREEEGVLYDAMIAGFTSVGLVPGKNVVLEERFPGDVAENFDLYANQIVASQPDVLVAVSPPSAFALQKATRNLPIVITLVPDPVGMKLVSSLARPGGNITGLPNFNSDLAAKRLHIIKETVPQLSSVALVVDPAPAIRPTTLAAIEDTRAAAKPLNLPLEVFEASNIETVERLFPQISGFGAAIFTGVWFFNQRQRIAELALASKLPTMGQDGVFADKGFLVSYGPSWPAIVRNVGPMVKRILDGEKPADMPVLQPTAFDFVLNAKTAKALGLTIPPAIFALATRVIE